jgi:hypothetical protein
MEHKNKEFGKLLANLLYDFNKLENAIKEIKIYNNIQ